MYTKQQFGKELKEMIARLEPSSVIGAWAHDIYYKHIFEIDSNSGLRKLLLCLGAMEEGPQFERSYEELNDIADKLIAGQDVKL